MTVYAGNTSWMIPAGQGGADPAGCRHSIRMWGEVAMRTLYLPAGADAGAGTGVPRALCVAAAARTDSAGDRAGRAGFARAGTRAACRRVLDEIARARGGAAAAAAAGGRAGAAVAQDVLGAPGEAAALDALARRHGAGRRTLERIFRAETGMSFGMWQQKARLLVFGAGAGGIAARSPRRRSTPATASVSAYIAAFKRTFGCTPGRL